MTWKVELLTSEQQRQRTVAYQMSRIVKMLDAAAHNNIYFIETNELLYEENVKLLKEKGFATERLLRTRQSRTQYRIEWEL